MKVAGLGIACLDRIARTGPMDKNNSSSITEYTERLGGLTANALLAAGRLGAEVSIITAVGDDETGLRILKLLEEEGIGTERVAVLPGKDSYFSFITVAGDSGERFIYCRRDTVGPEEIKADRTLIGSADVFLVDSHFMSASLEAAGMARELGVPVVGDFKLNPDNTEILKYTDYPIVSRDYALSLSCDGSIEAALRRMASFNPGSVPVVTCGSEGCYYMRGNDLEHVPAFGVAVRDTAAAGDVFHGGFAAALASGCSLRASLVFASAVSALKCAGFGGSAASPGLEEVKLFLKKRNY